MQAGSECTVACVMWAAWSNCKGVLCLPQDLLSINGPRKFYCMQHLKLTGLLSWQRNAISVPAAQPAAPSLPFVSVSLKRTEIATCTEPPACCGCCS